MSNDICWVKAHQSHPDAPWNQPDADDLTFDFEVTIQLVVRAVDRHDAVNIAESLIKPSAELLDVESIQVMEI